MDIINLKAWEMKEKLLNKEISSREIIEAHIAKIDEVENDINAFISIDREKALKDADLIDEKIRNNEKLGSLVGLPIGVKDNIITKDFKTTAGSKILENFNPPYDATVIERIKKNNGIIIGKTNLDEFAMGVSGQLSHFGPTKNPLDTSKVPGGSSGGSAAALAAKEVALSIGSDTGGSNRMPASFCGVVGIKPTYGLVSRYGLISLSDTFDQVGAFGRDVRDAVLMLNSISGHDERDVSTTKNNTIVDLKSLESIKGMKIALPKEFFQLDMNPKVREEMEKSIRLFKDAGAIVEEVSIPTLKYAVDAFYIIIHSDFSSNMARYDGIRYGHRAKDYSDLDELYINSRTEGFGAEVRKRILFGTYLLSGHRGEEYYTKALKIRTKLMEEFNNIFSRYDIILSPTNENLPYDSGELGLKENSFKGALLQTPINLAGLCALSMPTGNKEGLPVGLQIIGDRFREDNIIKAALAFEGMVK